MQLLKNRTWGLSFLFLAFTVAVGAQTPPVSKDPVVGYHLFFRIAAHLGEKSDELDRTRGVGSGQSLTRAFASKLGLSLADSAKFINLAREVNRSLTSVDKEASDLIAATQKLRLPGGLVPPAPPELIALENKRRDIVRAGIASITAQFAPDALSRISKHVGAPAAIIPPATPAPL